jgi:pimeloyl-ACP methyl ester carboxylesterase
MPPTISAMRTLSTPVIAAIALLANACGVGHRPEPSSPRSPEEIVYAHSNDDVLGAGVLFSPPADSAKQVAMIWVHGWGVNFYQPSYIAVGRALAQHGYTTICGNTRMHDLANIEGYRDGKRIRGGGYWGVAGDEVRDIAAWVDLAERRGFKSVVLIGHSAGWSAVRTYVSNVRDPRVVGIVLASGEVSPDTRRPDVDQLRQAQELMAKGEGDALIRDPKRDFPSYISAATFLDIWPSDAARSVDFFGVQTPNAPITHVHAPLLAFFGTSGDVGGETDLNLLTSGVARQKQAPRVTTALIHDADHMYTGQEQQVADVIAKWAAGLGATR